MQSLRTVTLIAEIALPETNHAVRLVLVECGMVAGLRQVASSAERVWN